MSLPTNIITVLLCSSMAAAYADQGSPDEKKPVSAPIYLDPSASVETHHYNMQNSNSKEHFSNGGRWTVVINQGNQTWDGRGAGVIADGVLDCESGVCSAILQGEANVNIPTGSHCDHFITVVPTGSDEIIVAFTPNPLGDCSAGHSHVDSRKHGGSAHGTETQ